MSPVQIDTALDTALDADDVKTQLTSWVKTALTELGQQHFPVSVASVTNWNTARANMLANLG